MELGHQNSMNFTKLHIISIFIGTSIFFKSQLHIIFKITLCFQNYILFAKNPIFGTFFLWTSKKKTQNLTKSA